MAVAVGKVTGANYTSGNKTKKIVTLTFSGNYATAGESLTPANVGLRVIDTVNFLGPARSTDLATAIALAYNHATSKVLAYEGSADGTALAEKTNAEAYPTGCNVRAEITGH